MCSLVALDLLKLGKVSSLSSQTEQCLLLKACAVSLAPAVNLRSAHAGSTVAPGSGENSLGRKQSCEAELFEARGLETETTRL